MKSIPWLALALILGLVLGGWGPRADLQQARAEIARLKAEARQAARPRAELGAISAFLPVPGANGPAARNRTAPVTRSPRSRRPAESDPGEEHRETAPPPAPPGRPAGEERFEEQIRKAAELWRTRAELARSTFIANVTTTEDEGVLFDATMETMNARLAESLQRWADTLKQEQTLSPETGVRMMNDLSGTLVQTYDELDAGLPEGWRAKAGESFQLLDFIDPEVAMPLADVQDVLARQRPAAADEGADTEPGPRARRLTLGIHAHDHTAPASPAPRR